MIKRVFGVLLFLIGIYLSLSIVTTILKMLLIEEKDFSGNEETYVFGYYLGKIGMIIVFCFITFLCYKHGYRFMKGKSKVVPIEEIDSIGKNGQ